MRRILIYVHYNKNNALSEHVVYQLRKIKPLFKKVILITNSNICQEDLGRLFGLHDEFLQRENSGYDFAAWRDGLNLIGWKKLSAYDSVTMMNDTCFGPIYDIGAIYTEMEKKPVDFWGLTDHASSQKGMPGTNGPIPHHIQSYMTVYNKNVISSSEFQLFWTAIKDLKETKDVIQKYETRLTKTLSTRFKWLVYFDTEKYSKEHNINIKNYSELLPRTVLENRVPLLKIKAFLHEPKSTIFKKFINSDYPIKLIKDHLETMNFRSPNKIEFIVKKIYVFLRNGNIFMSNVFSKRK